MTSLKLEIKTNHRVDPTYASSTVQIPKEPVTAPKKRTMVDTTNCPDTGTNIFLSGKHTMQKMGLKVANLHKDQTRCSTLYCDAAHMIDINIDATLL